MGGGMIEAVGQLMAAAGIHLPAWGVPAFALLLMAVMLPRLVRNMRTGQARKLLGRSRVLEGDARQAMEAEAMALVKGHGPGLVAIADEALRLNRRGLAEDAVAQLKATGELRSECRRLAKELAGDPLQGAPTSLAFALLVDNLIEGGLVAEAERKLAHARVRWPADPAVDGAAKRVAEARAARHSHDAQAG